MNRLLAELIGTFALVFVGTGAIMVNATNPEGLGGAGIGLVFGLIIMVMIYAFGTISGAHFNPAVTFAFWLAGRIEGHWFWKYAISQIAGACAASVLLFCLFPESSTYGETVSSIGLWPGFIVEVVISFLLMLTIFSVSVSYRETGVTAALAVGGMVAVAALVAGPWTGAGMNPARSIGPAIVSQNWGSLWVYIVAPLTGMALATPLCQWLNRPESHEPEDQIQT